MKILAIIISYNFMPWIDRCLPSLLASTQPVDIMVIDNGSTDGTLDTLRRRYPQIRLMANHSNLGFGRANNMAMQTAIDEGYEAVFLINQDAWVKPDTLALLASADRQAPGYGILSPVHYAGDGQSLDKGFASYIKGTKAANDRQPVDCDFINAALWYVPADIIRKVGFFSPLFYHYGEDKDYVNRLHYHGYRIGYLPAAKGYHDRGGRPP